MKIIMQGDKRVIDNIMRENRVRAQRGEVKFIPVECAAATAPICDDKSVTVESDTKTPRRSTKDKKTPVTPNE